MYLSVDKEKKTIRRVLKKKKKVTEEQIRPGKGSRAGCELRGVCVSRSFGSHVQMDRVAGGAQVQTCPVAANPRKL